jgi:DNA-directed RNA polymerase specialized sigma24 family protein
MSKSKKPSDAGNTEQSKAATPQPSGPRGSDPKARKSFEGAIDSITYAKGRAKARYRMQKERLDHTLGPTGLLHEAVLKVGSRGSTGRDLYLAIIDRAMEQILIDHARARNTLKRGGFNESVGGRWKNTGDAPDSLGETPVLNADERALGRKAFEALEQEDAELAAAVKIKFSQGCDWEIAAKAMGLPTNTLKTRYNRALVRLRELLESKRSGRD